MVRFRDPLAGRETRAPHSVGEDDLSGVEFAPHGHQIAIVAIRDVALRDVASGDEVARLRHGEDAVRTPAVATAPDGRILGTGGMDGLHRRRYRIPEHLPRAVRGHARSAHSSSNRPHTIQAPMRTRLPTLPLVLVAVLGMAPDPITVFLAGDSTMAQKLASRRPETGWGEALQQYFDIDRVRVVNLARNGRSTRSFVTEGRWDALLAEVRAGDYVFIQFGHNDEKVDNPSVYADAETDYPGNLRRFARDVRARGAHPVLLTPVARRRFAPDGTVQDTHGAYPDAVRTVARTDSIPLIDMQSRSTALLREYGVDDSRRLFLHVDSSARHPNYPRGVRDDTHFSPHGAEVMAREVVAGIREVVPALAEHLDPGVTPR